MKRFSLLAVAVAGLLGFALPAFASPIVIGGAPNTNNCYPFSCSYNREYQQVYDQGAFSGPITITGLEFFNTQYNSGATATDSGTWTISLSSTSADSNSLSSTFANNLGGDNTQVFSGNLAQPWAFGDTLVITFATPFTYNPANGNLLMDVNVSGASSPGGHVYFDATSATTVMGRVYDYGSGPVVDSKFGLVTGFLNTATSVPEPGNLALFGLGVALLTLGGYATRKRQRVAAPTSAG